MHSILNKATLILCRTKEPDKAMWEKLVKADDSPVAQSFMGLFKCSFICGQCKHTHEHTFKSFWDISIPIAKVIK